MKKAALKLWCAALAVLPLYVPRAAAAAPNILHIHSDDHRADALHALGTKILQTPHLDAIAARGMVFSRAYTQGSLIGAVCLPSRTMMLTGRSWQRINQAEKNAPLLPKVITAAGYETWHMGKGGNEFKAGIEAFDTNIVDNGKPAERRAGASQRLADKFIEFAKTRDKNKPFYAYLAPPVPHDPRFAPPQFHKLYDPAKIPLPPAFLPMHPFDNGAMTVRDETLAPWPRTPENTRRQIADYYACISNLDAEMGRVFAALKASGQWENTVVIFSGDNGLSLGDHGLFGKQNLYELGGMHVPLIIAGPGIQAGQSSALVYLMDLFPTLCDLAGAPIPAKTEGQSLLPLLQGKATKVRAVLYTAYQNSQRAVRDDRWKLIRYPLVDTTQLFDLQNDPHELKNLATAPEHAAKVSELTALLAQEMKRFGDDAPLRVPNPQPAAWTPPVNPAAQTAPQP